jgi:hypothetical protein
MSLFFHCNIAIPSGFDRRFQSANKLMKNSCSAKCVFVNESFLRSGFIIPLGHRLELGLAGGFGLTNDSPDWEARFGLYWTWQRGEEISEH